MVFVIALIILNLISYKSDINLADIFIILNNKGTVPYTAKSLQKGVLYAQL